MTLRLLHIISSANPAGGGPIEGIKQLSKIHREDGYTVELACLDEASAPWVKDFPLPLHALGGSGGYRYSSQLVPWLRANRGRFDVVIVNGIWQYSSFGVWRALQATQTPYFVFTHGMLDPWFKRTYPLKHLKKQAYWMAAEYRVLRDAAGVLFTCDEERRLARQSFSPYRCREEVIGFGTNDIPGDAEVQRAVFLARFPQLRDKRLLLFLGRVHEKKGPDLMLAAFARVCGALPQPERERLHLVIAGPNDDPHGLRMMALASQLGIDDSVTWTGMISGELKWGAFRAADAFILPSHQENFGVAVAEALACGVPALISRQVNIWPEIELAGAGFAESDDLDGTVRLIDGWLRTESDAWNRMRENARQCFQEHFRIETAARALVSTIQAHRTRASGV